MPIRPIVRPHPLAFQQRTVVNSTTAQAKQNKEEAEQLETKVTSLESDPFFITLDGGGPVVEDTDIFDGGAPDA